jgi:hypothetical protein
MKQLKKPSRFISPSKSSTFEGQRLWLTLASKSRTFETNRFWFTPPFKSQTFEAKRFATVSCLVMEPICGPNLDSHSVFRDPLLFRDAICRLPESIPHF